MLLDRLDRIGRATRHMTARRWPAGRGRLVPADGGDDRPAHGWGGSRLGHEPPPGSIHRPPDSSGSAHGSVSTRASASSTQVRSWAKPGSSFDGTTVTRYHRPGRRPSRSACLSASRSRRRIRLRRTAPPLPRPIAHATAGTSHADRSGGSHHRRRIRPSRTVVPCARRQSNCSFRPMRPTTWCPGSGREPLTALASPVLDDGTTRTVRHAMTEAVLLGSTAPIGLVRTLHVLSEWCSLSVGCLRSPGTWALRWLHTH